MRISVLSAVNQRLCTMQTVLIGLDSLRSSSDIRHNAESSGQLSPIADVRVRRSIAHSGVSSMDEEKKTHPLIFDEYEESGARTTRDGGLDVPDSQALRLQMTIAWNVSIRSRYGQVIQAPGHLGHLGQQVKIVAEPSKFTLESCLRDPQEALHWSMVSSGGSTVGSRTVSWAIRQLETPIREKHDYRIMGVTTALTYRNELEGNRGVLVRVWVSNYPRKASKRRA
ncbi:hypothetical protein P175DRAFT_0558816 [Aspergillus ochraceoroseus IBT 24754]|uniref:Uncharacterized protein n=1 Tax=Aspergillus ochraceoroseus IBT 24754 TaxID=1392256 RepID=A0A2T5LSK1_9EURO|nr:uncharacterized protein P175DRAFT_0558816 [Aspergillus ochraceoroseus IBT 24754]PTU19251.1 hypothetical protein P175DRAFT_0558816 [Aspergillus ochraceoroseus IBT 24754]